MRIVIIGSAYPLRGGLASYNERLAKEYIKQGNEVIIYTFSLQYPKILFPGKTQYSNEKPPENLDIRIKVNSINPLNWIKIGREIKKLKPDLIITKYWIPFMSPCLGTISRISKKNKITKVISILDNIIPHEKRICDNLLSKYFVKSVDGFVAMSQSVLDDLQTFDNIKPTSFCPHPLFDNFGEAISKALAKKILKLKENTNYILFFGFIRDYKGLDLLLEAVSDDRLKNLPIKLIVAGEFYSDSKPYYEIIKRNNLDERVIMHTDFIKDSEVVNYFCAADIVVQPYKTATQSGVTQIAYHFNKPMIVTDVGGLSEIIPDKKVGFVVKTNPKAIAEAIYTFYDQNLEFDFVKNVKVEKEKYSWKRMTEAVNEVFNKLKNNDNKK
ncbi:MAG: glycosyltransferase [Bacteroidales bacterium]|nr:glycosyltransferase [Bacteroidales bacterium]